jgi:putative transposase
MNNHVHFIAIPNDETGLAKLFNNTHARYSQYFNRQRNLKGHLWQGRFYSCILDDAHLYRAVRYVENNPVRAKIVKKAWEYKWSSALDHTGEREEPLIRIKTTQDRGDWREYLQEDDSQLAEEVRRKTNKGLVVGTDEFVKKLEKRLDRSLQCLSQGRPRKSK